MEPFSLLTGVLGLLETCLKVGTALRELFINVATVDIKIKGLHSTVTDFANVLKLMEATLEQPEVASSIGSTGHINNLWEHLLVILSDGKDTLTKFDRRLQMISSKVSIFEGAQKLSKLQDAAQEIMCYQDQIKRYNDAIQISLGTVILWNQVTLKQSTDQITPSLDTLHQKLRNFTTVMTRSMSELHSIIKARAGQGRDVEGTREEVRALENLNRCVSSAARIYSEASTTLGIDQRSSGSITEDDFPYIQSATLERYLSTNAIHNQNSTSHREKYSVAKSPLLEEMHNPDINSEDEGEVELIQDMVEIGKKLLDDENHAEAENHLLSCLNEICSQSFTVSRDLMSKARSAFVRLLWEAYLSQDKLKDGQALLMDNINSDPGLVSAMGELVKVLFEKEDYLNALICGKRALSTYGKMEGQERSVGEEATLRLLIKVCKAQGNQGQQLAYEARLSRIVNSIQPRRRSDGSFADRSKAQSPRQYHKDKTKGYSLEKPWDYSAELFYAQYSPAESSNRERSDRDRGKLHSKWSQSGPSAPNTAGADVEIPEWQNFSLDRQYSPSSVTSLATPDLTGTESTGSGPNAEPNTPQNQSSIVLDKSKSYFPHSSPDANGKRVDNLPLLKSALEEEPNRNSIGRNGNSRQRHNSSYTGSKGLYITTVFDFEEKYASRVSTEDQLSDGVADTPEPRSPQRGHPSEPHKSGRTDSFEEKEDQNKPQIIRRSTVLTFNSSKESKSNFKKVVIVGASKCGKTALFTCLMQQDSTQRHTNPSTWDVGTLKMERDDMQFDLNLWEFQGSHLQAQRGLKDRVKSLPDPAVFLICFSMASPKSLALAEQKWVIAIQKLKFKAPWILVGLKSDLRFDPQIIEELKENYERPLTVKEGHDAAERINAVQYLECSAKTGTGVHEILEAATQLALLPDLAKRLEQQEKEVEKQKKREAKRRESVDKASSGTSGIRHLFKRSSTSTK